MNFKSKDEIIESLIMSMETRGEKKGQGCVLLKLFMYSNTNKNYTALATAHIINYYILIQLVKKLFRF